MLNIVLVCNWGASTGMLAKKITEAAEEKGIEVNVTAQSFDDVADVIGTANIILLGPQVAFKLQEFERKYESVGVPFMVINTIDYGRMNGMNVLNAVLEKIKN